MDRKDMPGFQKLDLVEIFYDGSHSRLGMDSEVRYAIGIINRKHLGPCLIASPHLSAGTPVTPKYIPLYTIDKIVVYGRNSESDLEHPSEHTTSIDGLTL